MFLRTICVIAVLLLAAAPAPAQTLQAVDDPSLALLARYGMADDLLARPGALTEDRPATPRESRVGTIIGTVTDAMTLQPLAGVQVHIPEGDIGTLTGANGRFILPNVPDGQVIVRADRIGYVSAESSVLVSSGATVTVDFELREEALQLDEVVVTGTPGGSQRRELGNLVAQVDAAEITELAPIATVQDLLTAREPGVSFTGIDGNVGGGRAVRIRGISSLSMSSQPLIYVDGIRVDNEAGVGPSVQNGRQATRLNDFDPEDIASIEIIKGPAAATLYGTEASAGVIQIITKRGETGAPQFDLAVRQGGTWLMNDEWKVGDAYGIDRETGELLRFNIVERQKERGEPLFTTGHQQSYDLSMRGGTDAVRYFLSSGYSDNTGYVDYNWDKRFSLRSNVNVLPTERTSIALTVGYVEGLTRFAQPDRYEVWSSARWSNPTTVGRPLDGFFRSPPEAHEWISATRDYRRITASATFQHNPTDWFDQRLIVGTDVAADENEFLVPRHPLGREWWLGGSGLGEKEVERPVNQLTTVDYAASLSYDVTDELRFTNSAGLQYYGEETKVVAAEGSEFPATPVTSISSAANTLSTESFVETKSVGMYLQHEIAWRDRLYLTGAVRGDDHSTFGSNFEAAIYPKLSASWVVSDENFWQWDNLINSFRLRGAWGKAGRQPDTFAGVTLFEGVVGPTGRPAVVQNVLGNPDVGPEVSTELEVGFDLAMWNDRLSTELTYYTQDVEDALISVPVATSSGFPGSQSRNLGRLSNWGWELQVTGRVLDQDSYALDLGVGYSYNNNRVEDLGGTPETDWLREGFRYPSSFYRKVVPTSGEFNADGLPVNVLCDGGVEVDDGYGLPGGDPVPCSEAPLVYHGPAGTTPEEASFSADLTLFNNLSFRAMAEWRGDAFVIGNDILCRFSCYPNTQSAVVRDHPVMAKCGVDRTCGTERDADAIFGFNSSFAKLRELSATYTLPQSLVGRTGMSRASISLAAHNIWTIYQAQTHVPDWLPPEQGASVQDPEVRSPSETGTSVGVYSLPPGSSVLATLRVSF